MWKFQLAYHSKSQREHFVLANGWCRDLPM
ncbi:protein of unknown function (plasmid) [Cupriavidus taiwanensis]|uniref:Uncharacterized protein n=1 Tax=Cupriavidus taiwanensis TaxID=164546 RepID=A0A375IQR0_9BURK|nr:protein of unknown function [Cupriavidus taiwanensis]